MSRLPSPFPTAAPPGRTRRWDLRRLAILLIVSAGWIGGVSLAATPPNTPRKGGTLRLWFASDLRSLDPAIAYEYESTTVCRLIFRGLLDYNAEGRLVADQAEAWSVSPDGRVYTFRLRPGHRFGHGREVEAEDYRVALERVLSPATGSPGQGFFTGIRGARDFMEGRAARVAGLMTPDTRTLVIELEEPVYTFRHHMAMAFAAPVPRELLEQPGGEFQHHLTGTGPYRLERWRRGSRIQLDRNRHYPGPDGWVDAVDILIGGDQTTAAMMLENGELDRIWADSIQARRFRRLPDRASWYEAYNTVATYYLFLNNELPPFQDPRIRQAANLAIDKRRLLRLLGDIGTVAEGIIPPTMPWSNPGRPRLDYDPEKARALLRDAGHPDGVESELWFDNQTPGMDQLAAAIQYDLKQVGIRVELRQVTISAMAEKIRSRRQVPCGVSYWGQDYPDPSNFLNTLFDGSRITDRDCLNIAFYNNPAVNQLLQSANGSQHEDERLRQFREAERRILLDAPWVPLIHPQFPILRHPRLRGDVPHPTQLWRYEDMWLAE